MPHEYQEGILVTCDECFVEIRMKLNRGEQFQIHQFDSSPQLCREKTLDFIVGSLYSQDYDSWKAPKKSREELTDRIEAHGQFARREIDDTFDRYSYESVDYSDEFIAGHKGKGARVTFRALRKQRLTETNYSFPIAFCDYRKHIGFCTMNPEVVSCPDCGLEVLNAPSNVTWSYRQDLVCPQCGAAKSDPFDTTGILKLGKPPHHGNWGSQEPIFEFGGTDYFQILHSNCVKNNEEPGFMEVIGVWVDDIGRVVLSLECVNCGARNALKPYTSDDGVILLNQSAIWQRVESRISQLVHKIETESFERKTSLRWSHKRNARDLNMEYEVAEAVAALMVTHGGIVFIGQDESKDIKGIEADIKDLPNKKKRDEQGFLEHLAYVLNRRLSPPVPNLWRATLEKYGVHTLCIIEIEKASVPVFVRLDDGREILVIRNGPHTQKLDGKQQDAYLNQRFPNR